MDKNESKCERCGVTSKTCGTFFHCPMFKKEKTTDPDRLVCHKCHEKCPNLKIYNGYMEVCAKSKKYGA